MSVLSSTEVKRRLHLRGGDPKGLVITPLIAGGSFDQDAADVRLGTHFLMPKSSPHAFFAPDENTSRQIHKRVHVPLGDYFVLPAHQTVLGATLEFIRLPYDVSAMILTKSSIARTFIVVETAPWIHPEYRGCLTLEIANVSNTPVLLYPGRPIGQIVFFSVAGAKRKKTPLEGNYVGPVFPEAPKFKAPQRELRALGLDRVRIIPQRQWIKTE